MTDNLPEFASGTIATGPTAGVFGESGPEALIPLNDRGAKFMRDAMGGSGGGGQTIIVELDGKVLAKSVVPRMHDVVRLKLGYT